jgi:hypothetical protein
MSTLENKTPSFRRNGSNQAEKICENYEKQNKFAGNSRIWVYSKCAEFRFYRTMEGVTTDMKNGF